MRTSRNYFKYRKRIAHATLDIYIKGLSVSPSLPFPLHGVGLLNTLNRGGVVSLRQVARARGKHLAAFNQELRIPAAFFEPLWSVRAAQLSGLVVLFDGLARVVCMPDSRSGWLSIIQGLSYLIDQKGAAYRDDLETYTDIIREQFKRPSDFVIKRAAGV